MNLKVISGADSNISVKHSSTSSSFNNDKPIISNLSEQIIQWPTNNEKTEIESHFRNNGFPRVTGIIDGSHIRIDKPEIDLDSYLNRKKRLFDTGKQLMKMFENCIQHCFGVLKQKFRQLYHIKLRKIPDIVDFIRACCVLHNLAICDNFDEGNVCVNEIFANVGNYIEEAKEEVIHDRESIEYRDFLSHTVADESQVLLDVIDTNDTDTSMPDQFLPKNSDRSISVEPMEIQDKEKCGSKVNRSTELINALDTSVADNYIHNRKFKKEYQTKKKRCFGCSSS
ncbi:hypothetical protein MML48_9g00007557 [Holotrichia oblita]|uniref:Uncharacterized protein n=1 Tax=Holotrichia oblita TaxID=644536 RepID=A0ACB9SLI5_HOLOL|nr:hypothetical protein MML48_9g00007557 [Holotrichia oblita]